MNLSELTDKIYAEGVEKGNAEAQQIVEKANAKAADIIAEAEKKAAAIVAEAENKSADLNKKTRAELKLYAEQSVNAVKTEIVNLLADKIAADSVKAATADAKFMQGVIAKLAEQMAKDGEVLVEAMQVMCTKDKYGREVVDPKHGIYVVVGAMSDSSVDVAVKQYVLVAERLGYVDRAKEVIYNALNAAGISIPFPQCDVHLIKDE